MVNILIDPLPVSLQGVEINADFRTMIKIDHLIQGGEDIPLLVAMDTALGLFYKKPPPDPQRAITDMIWFYLAGEDKEPDEAEILKEKLRGGGIDKAYDFYEDSALIYAAFLAQYGLDLTEIEYLHWWKFKALFANIDESQMINKIMEYRTVDTKGMDKKLKASYDKLKRHYRLKTGREQRRMTLNERNQAMKEYVAKHCSC